jgi:chromate transporter
VAANAGASVRRSAGPRADGAAGLADDLLASAVAFAPSLLIVLFGGPRFEHIRGNDRARSFLDGAIGVITALAAGAAFA